MKLLIIGLNHKTAPVAMREQLAFTHEKLTQALPTLYPLTQGVVILSTCNRTEIYALVAGNRYDTSTESFTQLQTLAPKTQATYTTYRDDKLIANKQYAEHFYHIIYWLAQFQQLTMADILPYLYGYENNQALNHLLRVASGLDSMILGEPQILGQLKQALHVANESQAVTKKMQWLFEQVFAAAKRVRHETQIGAQAVSLGFAVAKLVTQIFDEPHNNTLLLVAAGEMNRLVATHVAALGIKQIIICNRSMQRAQDLAETLVNEQTQVRVIGLDGLDEALCQADIVSSCSGSMTTLIHAAAVKTALKKRRYQPMLLVDLAVPRDIDANVTNIDDVYLYSIDDLQHVIAGNLEQRKQAAVSAEVLISQLVIDTMLKFQVRQMGRQIKRYRDNARMQSEQELQKALLSLNKGKNAEVVLAELTHKLTQTLLHAPSQLLRAVASQKDPEVMEFVLDNLHDAGRE